ncbi:hypothetical protein [Treponema berlinense]|uniref:hypothetical protein n=1 Tax=Treponema berlinense TaxID=225004 RepID=UPI0026E9AEB3|nr:hypothetical protein [Treponema berlinense]
MKKFQLKIMERVLLTGTFLLIFVLCSGCQRQKKSEASGTEEITEEQPKVAVKLNTLDAQAKEYLEGKTLAVVLGHSYNDPYTVEKFRQLLNINYGVKTEEYDGLITLLVYPEDFMVSGKARVSSLYSKLEDENLAGIITFGAPEGLCNALARLEDDFIKTQGNSTSKRPYPVFCFFQQDDTLGSESTSDFVLDYTPIQTSIEIEQSANIPDFDTSLLMLNAIDEMLKLRGPLEPSKNLIQYVQKIVGKQKKVSNYTDYESGLKSVNHFIFN